jgi:CheY-like chemotaxis protein/anti-sigma regulatory factor (Ser/Thr protein kinase)
VDPAQVDLPALFGRLRGMVRPMTQDKPVEVIVSDDGLPAAVLTDEVALTGILRNLLSNGIKYTDRGEVRLTGRLVGPRLEISVADTGIGIPFGLHEHVFEEFYQVPGLRRGGTGLGLPYARRLARILGGDLELTSEPGAGTTVMLSLPNQTPALGTVVVADDDAAFRQRLKGLLAGLTDRLIEAGDGGHALALVAENPVDLVLADLRMPGLDGGDLLARLPASVPAIIITGADVAAPPRAAALLRKDELTRERLEFTIRGVL